ncbi:hypothetical protein CGZ93_17775 [Enemella dayhoffiae]|uniref:DUF2303 family protein n=1 Tax=Enemella dayhoffiae TaxID=2016507 RepID=A0A255GLB7_9ACTN|nr:DUF2303 family protein [Enemella dayhoffiae]OYO16610.1 hypothetical protein CGZ93_17775 [Enemella dayhoffiae]
MSNNTDTIYTQTPVDAEPQTAMVLTQTAQQAVLPRRLEDGGLYAVLRGDRIELIETPGYADRHADERADAPRMVHRQVTVTTAQSLLDHLARNTDDNPEKVGEEYLFNDGSLEVWANLDRRTITAHLDGVSGWRKHSATLTLKHSREWSEWSEVDGQLLPQVRFAQFIEDHLSTIGQPDGAELLDVCQTLQANTKVAFKSQQILANGQRQFQYEETVEAKAGQKGALKIPGELTLVLRPFQGSEPVAVTARFRYHLEEGLLRLGVRLTEPEKAVEDAFDGIVETVAAGVPVPVLYGEG